MRAQIVADYERDFFRLFGEEFLPIVKACFRSVATFVGSPLKNASVVERPSSSGTEIDFVLPQQGERVPIECKAALSVNLKHTRGLCDYMRMYRQPSGVLVSLAPQSVMDVSGAGKISNLPVYLAERL